MSAILFIIITLLTLILMYGATGSKAIPAVYLILILLTGIAAAYGLFRQSPPLLVAAIICAAIATTVIYRRQYRKPIKVQYLWAIHCLRIAVELILYKLYLAGKVPVFMTFEGWNYDIITGISAVFFLVYSLKKSRFNSNIIMLWNLAGIVLLSIVVITAILSAPLPIQQLAFEQPNIAVLEFPFCLLPVIVVPIVYLSHALLLRHTLQKT